MKSLFGYKIGMTRVYDENGIVHPVTVVKLENTVVTALKTQEKDGYTAVQLGTGKQKSPNKAMVGAFKKKNLEVPQVLKEFRLDNLEGLEVGSVVNGSVFEGVEYVDVTGVSKGKGFQGVQKRYSFRGGRASHGSHFHRAPGTIGMHSFPGRVYKGRKMPGHMGVDNVTTQNLKLIKNDVENGVLLIKGAIPGHNKSLVIVREAKKLRVS